MSAAGGSPAGRSGRPRRRLSVTVALLALLLVVTIAVPRGSRSTSTSTSLPSGRWGETIACLEHDRGYRVIDPASGRVPDARTRGVTVTRRAGDVELAEIRDAGSPAAARALARRSVGDSVAARAAGQVAWGFREGGSPPRVRAGAGDQTVIDLCVEHPRR